MMFANLLLNLNYWLYANYVQKLADTIWSIKHAGADGCYSKIWPLQLLTATLIIVTQVFVGVTKIKLTNESPSLIQLFLQSFVIALKVVFLCLLLIAFMRIRTELIKQPEYQLDKTAVATLLISYVFFTVPIPVAKFWVMQIMNQVSVILFLLVLIWNAGLYNKE